MMDRYDARAEELLQCDCGSIGELHRFGCAAAYRNRFAAELRRMGAELDAARKEQLERDCAAVCEACRRGLPALPITWESEYRWYHQDGVRYCCDADAIRIAAEEPSPAVVERAVNLFAEHKHDA